ncbi:MAG: hypothetical protein TREMPRED_001315 [Tremellales sp. Tagirdzhanova-0007]|nr:MAG: hypothetical protein TREMPRED_001315 [Tremellales sp. Tagirdzhanova-0007]
MSIQWHIPPPELQGEVTWSPKAMPDVSVKTWYRVNGKLKGGKTPIIVVHGGPGCPHDYLLNWTEILPTGHPVIFYDQIGCGKSTRLPEDKYQPLWVEDTFIEELEHVVKHLVSDNDDGNPARGCILAGHSLDSQESVAAARSRIPELSSWAQKVIRECEEKDDYENEDYQKASMEFLSRFGVDFETAPEEVRSAFDQLVSVTHVYGTMWGPSEFKCTGNLASASLNSVVHKLAMPILVIYGTNDEIYASQDQMIKRWTGSRAVTRVVLEGARHLAHVDDPQVYYGAVREWLKTIG